MGKVIQYRQLKKRETENCNSLESYAIVEHANALDCYENWLSPTVIVSDGPYGLAKFPGDPKSPDSIAEIYAPHIAAWSKYATPQTTLWFWCSELGWAEVHSLIKAHGWQYKAAHIWDKGIGHIAGNCNGDSIRGFPVVSEICVQYVREASLTDSDGIKLSLKAWLRKEWQRSGLPLRLTNVACGVKNAATRKYFTQCHLWYIPPADKIEALANYATHFGKKTDQPYFSLDGLTPVTASQWERLRSKWNHAHGVTNVWSEPAVRGDERIRAEGLKSLHANQKPLKLMRRIIEASSDKGDVVWEPFGGLCSATVAALELGRIAHASELLKEFYASAYERLEIVREQILNGSNRKSDTSGPRRIRA